jgi:hypothetical protein
MLFTTADEPTCRRHKERGGGEKFHAQLSQKVKLQKVTGLNQAILIPDFYDVDI